MGTGTWIQFERQYRMAVDRLYRQCGGRKGWADVTTDGPGSTIRMLVEVEFIEELKRSGIPFERDEEQ